MASEARDTIQCVHCGGEIKAAAKICKHCTRPVGAQPVEPDATPAPAWTATGPSPVLVELRSFVVRRGLLRYEQVDRVLNANPGVDAGVALGHLAAAGYLTTVQAETLRAAFWQHQGQRAQAVLNAAVQRGFLLPAHVQTAMSQYESVALQQTIGEFLTAKQLLTPAQAAELTDTRSFLERVEPRARWNALPRTLRGGVLGAVGVVMLLVVFAAVRGEPDVRDASTMDGWGHGTTTFTNRGRRAGSVCGHIFVVCGRGTRSSPTFCSGTVAPNDTRRVDFTVVGMERIVRSDRVWTDDCEFEFIPETRGD
jgi:hypothetical protein